MNISPARGSSEQLCSLLSEYLSPAEKELEQVFSNGSCRQIADICKHVIEAEGKRVRPLLTLLACEAVKGDYVKAVPVSVATELAHTLSLIQDERARRAARR